MEQFLLFGRQDDAGLLLFILQLLNVLLGLLDLREEFLLFYGNPQQVCSLPDPPIQHPPWDWVLCCIVPSKPDLWLSP